MCIHRYITTQVRAYDDRSICSFVRNSYASTLCPVVICHYLFTSETEAAVACMLRAVPLLRALPFLLLYRNEC